MNTAALLLLLRRWVVDGEERALVECLAGLRAALTVSSSIVRALGPAEIEHAREDLLIKLLDRARGARVDPRLRSLAVELVPLRAADELAVLRAASSRL